MRSVRVWILAAGFLIASCSMPANDSKGVYLLFGAVGAENGELKPPQAIVNYLLATLEPKDSLAVARIDSESFSENDIIARVTFDPRPSLANNQKRALKEKLDGFVARESGGPYADISGGILQAIEYLNTTGCRRKYILIFSDLKADAANGHARDVPFQLSGFTVIALHPNKARNNARNLKHDLSRIEAWRNKIEGSNGQWQEIDDAAGLADIFEY